MEMSKMFFFALIPAFVVGPIAGVYIDRWDRRTTLFISYFIQSILILLVAFYIVRLPSIWPMYIVVFIISSLSRFYIPAKMSLIPEIVHKDDLLIANSLSNVTGMIAGGLGMLLGSFIVDRTGYFSGFCWDAICYFLSAALVFSITALHYRFPNKKAIIVGTKAMLQTQKSIWHENVEGIRYIRSQKQISFIFWMMFVLLAAVGGIYVVGIVFIQEAFHSVTKDLGLLGASFGLGAILGSLAYGSWGKKIAAYKVIFVSLILGGAMVVLFTCVVAATHDRFVASGISLLLGFVIGPVMVAPPTVINKICPMEMSGKVFTAMEFVNYFAFLLALGISSFLSVHVQGFWILVGVGGIFVVVGIVGLIKFKGAE